MTKTYRFKFEKSGRAKFTGHLDCLQTFQRAIKRADLPIAYSQGFNPHQQIAFGSPLSLGYTTVGDYGDFKLTEDMDTNEVMEKLNAVMPNGLKILSITKLREGVKNTMASLSGARYIAIFNETIEHSDIENYLEKFSKQEEIFVMKKTKKGINEADIRSDMLEVYKAEFEDKPAIGMLVSSGSVRNLKPESVANAFCNFVGKEYNRYKMDFQRVEMYMMTDEKLVPLNFGVEEE